MNDRISRFSSALSPQSPQAHAIALLLIAVIVLASVIALVVAGLVVIALVRYRDRGQGTPRQGEGIRWVETVYTLIPLGLMISLYVFTVITMRRAEPAINQPPQLLVIGHQWWWELRYPDAGIVTANEIHLPVGTPLRAALSSTDVIHELWVPQLGPKLDLVPGFTNQLLIQGDKVGTYLGACAEFCGEQHAQMRIRVVVQSPEDFRAWEEAQRRNATATTAIATLGRDFFFSHSCVECHAISGTSARGDAGPDLSHLASRAMLAADTLENTPQNLRRWLADPQAIKPGCRMPNMKMSDREVAITAAYLESLK